MATDSASDKLDDDIILFNIADAENKQPFFELAEFTREFAPEHLSTMDKVLRGEDVSARNIQKVMDVFVNKLVPLYNRDGSLDDPKMAQLHSTLVAVGSQL